MNKTTHNLKTGSVTRLMQPRLPSVYLVRWLDDEAGWKHIHVIAHSSDEAREVVAGVSGRPDAQVFGCH